MAWIFNVRPSMCSGTYHIVYPQKKLIHALQACQKDHEIMTVDVLQWSEVSYKDALQYVRHRRLHKSSTLYKWAK